MGKQRRYDIDWIRVIVFDILIIYHVGMFFVEWGWHIKNNDIVDWIQVPMRFVNQWRIPILFVVSGMGTRFALSHRTGGTYVKERFQRLFIPLIFGMLLIVPPQVYIERITQGQDFSSFLNFYPSYFDGIYPEGNFSWHHLWFLPYLLVMSLLATSLFLRLRNKDNQFILKVDRLIGKRPILLYTPILIFTIIEYFLHNRFPITHAFIGDWYALLLYFLLFIIGYFLICCKRYFWKALESIKFISLIIGIASFSAMQFDIIQGLDLTFSYIKSTNMWCWIIAIFGFAAHYLNHDSKIIRYRNKAVYPFYILHQTITVICGYFLMDLQMHYSIKMLIMILATFGFSWLIYEFIILRFAFIQPLFGVIKNK